MLPSSEPAKGCGRVALEDSVAFSCVLADVAASRMARRRSARSAATLSMRDATRDERKRDARALWRRTIPFSRGRLVHRQPKLNQRLRLVKVEASIDSARGFRSFSFRLQVLSVTSCGAFAHLLRQRHTPPR